MINSDGFSVNITDKKVRGSRPLVLRPVEGYIYLASPYSHPDPLVREERYKAVLFVAAKLMAEGHIVFCPIVHTHEIGKRLGRAVDHYFWLKQNRPLLVNASKMVILTLSGWDLSKGIEDETKISKDLGIPIQYLAPEFPS